MAGFVDHTIVMENQGEDTGVPNIGHLKVSWKGSMRFDDAIGKIVCEDNVRVRINTRRAPHATRSGRIGRRSKLGARPSDDPIGDHQSTQVANGIGGDPWAGGFGDGDRVLEWARFSGHAPIGQEPEPVKIESRTYAMEDPSLVVGLMYLEGAQVYADNLKQTLEVPSAGVLLVLDRSSEDEDPSADGASGDGRWAYTICVGRLDGL